MNEENNNNEFQQDEHRAAQNGEERLESGRPAVAAAPGKLLIFVVFAVLFLGIVVKSLFFASAPKTLPEVTKVITPANKTQPSISSADLPTPQPVLTAPPIPAPVPVAPPPPQMMPPVPPQISAKSGPTNEQLKLRIHAPMLLSGGAQNSISQATADKKKKNPATDPNTAFADTVAETSAETVEATKIKNMNITIAQGKLIQGVLETAIDSTLPGDVRAIVSHDTYAESGRSILVPKGSRIIGTYNSAIKHGQARVFIIWTRIIRPDGVDVTINSPGVDALGRAGMTGYVDNKYMEAFTAAIFTSSLDIGMAAVGDALFGNQQQTTSTGPSGGATTSTSSPTSTAMQTAIQNLGQVGQAIVGNAVGMSPTIHIDQGEMINIFVNKDVVFPSNLTSESGFIP